MTSDVKKTDVKIPSQTNYPPFPEPHMGRCAVKSDFEDENKDKLLKYLRIHPTHKNSHHRGNIQEEITQTVNEYAKSCRDCIEVLLIRYVFFLF